MREAFEQAKAKSFTGSSPDESKAESTETKAGAPDEDEQPADAPQVPAGKRLLDERGALQRILTLRRQGRVGELDAAAQGLLRSLEDELRGSAVTEHQRKEQQEAEFKDLYLTNLALKEEDPAAYVKFMDEKPELAIFMDSYRKAHPEVTLDDPNARPRKSEDQIRTEIADVYGRGFEGFIDAVAADGGLDDAAFKALKAEFQFGKHPDSANLTTFGAKLITALVDKAAEEKAKKLVEKVKRDERGAYDLQLQKVRGEQATPPRAIGGSARPPAKASDKPGPISMADALAEAKERLAV